MDCRVKPGNDDLPLGQAEWKMLEARNAAAAFEMSA
jgi:hypothetical protein